MTLGLDTQKVWLVQQGTVYRFVWAQDEESARRRVVLRVLQRSASKYELERAERRVARNGRVLVDPEELAVRLATPEDLDRFGDSRVKVDAAIRDRIVEQSA